MAAPACQGRQGNSAVLQWLPKRVIWIVHVAFMAAARTDLGPKCNGFERAEHGTSLEDEHVLAVACSQDSNTTTRTGLLLAVQDDHM